jgi:hypothetical protein
MASVGRVLTMLLPALVAAILAGSCGKGSPEFQPTERERRFLTVVSRAAGKQVAEEYRQLMICTHPAGVKFFMPDDPKAIARDAKRVGFAYSFFGSDLRRMKDVKECRPFV